MRFFLFLLLLLLFPVMLCAGLQNSSVILPKEEPASYQVVAEFYRKKAWSVFNSSFATKRERYNAFSFYSYPRIFFEDKIPNYAPYDKTGTLFLQALENTYESLRSKRNFDSQKMAGEVVKTVVLTPRRSDPLREMLMAFPGDIWYSSFQLVSFYEQLTDYIRYIQNNQKDYQEYQRRLKANDTWSLQGYAGRDFSVFEKNINEKVFLQRQAQISSFVSAYTATANSFIRSVLVPLQAQTIEGADVQKYLTQRVTAHDLPVGISKEQFIERLMRGMPSIAEFYEKAEQMNPSFKTQMQAAYKMLRPMSASVTVDDFFNALSLLEYISVGTLVDRLDEYGKVPTRQEVLDRMVGKLAAGALNKQLAAVADGLYEYEKPFYYSYGFSASVSQEIVKNWYLTAKETHVAGSIAKIAADNILQSGRRAYQDEKLVKANTARKVIIHAQQYRDALPIVTDFIAGDIVFQMAAVWPFAKNSKTVIQKVFKEKVIKSLNKVEDVATPSRSVASLEKVDRVARAQRIDLSKTRRIQRVIREDGLDSAVWRLFDDKDNVLGYLKYGSEQEFLNTQKLNQIIQETNILDELKMIDIDYPVLIGDSMFDLPAYVNMKVADDYEDLFINVRAAHIRMKKPFVVSEVDMKGVPPIDLYTRKISTKDFVKSSLGGKRITEAEWEEIVKFYRTLNQNGLVHEDSFHNAYLYRQANGKLKMTVLDFEPLYQKVYPDADMEHLNSYRKELAEIFAK